MTVQNAMTEYTRAAVMGPMIQDKRYFEQYMVNPEQKETAEVWKLAGDASWRMPNVTYTVDEANQIHQSSMKSTAMRQKWKLNFILGESPCLIWIPTVRLCKVWA